MYPSILQTVILPSPLHRYIYHTPTINDWRDLAGYGVTTYKEGQAFLVGEAQQNKIYSVKLTCYRKADAELVSLALRLSNSSYAVLGDNLATGSFEASLLSDDPDNPTIVEVLVDTRYLLELGQYFVIIFGAIGGDDDNDVYAGAYTPLSFGSPRVYYVDDASRWFVDNTRAYWFEEWGNK